MEDIIAKCEKCHDKFIQKYWDDELSWYIELSDARFCHACGEKAGLQPSSRNTKSTKKLDTSCRGLPV